MKPNTVVWIAGCGFLLLLSASITAQNKPGLDKAPSQDDSRVQTGFEYQSRLSNS